MQTTNCPICGNSATTPAFTGGPTTITCPRCGKYVIGDISAHVLSAWSPEQKANLSGWVRENPGSKIFEPALQNLASLKTPSVGEKADKLLLTLARSYPKAGTRIPIFKGNLNKTTNVANYVSLLTGSALPAICSQAWAQDDEEVVYIVVEYLVTAKKFLQNADDGHYKITPEGWSYVHTLTHGVSHGDTGFIAMWFAAEMEAGRLAIEEAIRRAGYKPLRIDSKEHNNKIDDEIIAAIRRSKFVVADFTGHRGGVYYEAGYAGGRDIPVIWLCRQDDLKNLHFDTRQYSHIVWNNEDLQSLTTSLQRRIEATIGRGPV